MDKQTRQGRLQAASVAQEDQVSDNEQLTTQAGLPAPLFTGKQMADSLLRYRELQTALDASMPDQLIELQGRQFRKKGYWRAINVAFGLTVELVSEERFVAGVFEDGHENFGYNVTYRAIAPNGRAVTGDGSCTAVEKAGRFKCPHPDSRNPRRTVHWPPDSCPSYDPGFRWRRLSENASEHNVRSHAHSRAFNRAVSNLVGFGEVSAEEVDRDAPLDPPPTTQTEPMPAGQGATPAAAAQQQQAQQPRPPRDDAPHPADLGDSEFPPETARQATQAPRQDAPRPQASQPPPQRSSAPPQQARRREGPVITDAQDRRYFALAMKAGWEPGPLKEALKEVWDYDRSDEILKTDYNRVVQWVQNGPPRG